MSMPSLTLLEQSLVSGLLAGGLYGLLALGLSLSWGVLRQVNLSHFALAFLAAYLTYHLGTKYGMHTVWSLVLIVPIFFVLGVLLHFVYTRFRITEFSSLIVTFGIAVIVESLIQWIWTADFRRYQTPLASESFAIGPVYVSILELIACGVAIVLSFSMEFWLQRTFVGKALRASVEDAEIATAFGVNHRLLSYLLSGVCASLAAVAGVFLALISTLAPSQIWNWLGVIFAVVIIGRLGKPIGALLAGFLIGASESLTMAVANPAWAPVVSFSILIALLLWRPQPKGAI